MFARTERLLLRHGWREDAAALAERVAHWDVVRMTARMPWPYGLAEAEAFLARAREPHEPDFLIFDRRGGGADLIGGIALMPVGERDARELGYWLTPAAWGRGFATEAGRAVMAMAPALGLRRVHAGHFADNPASSRVLVKLGFHPTGGAEQRFSLARRTTVDSVLYERDLAGAEVRPLAA